MIHEEICTYEVCKLAKEKGFDGSGCFKHYDQNGLLRSNRSFSSFDSTIDELYKHDTPSEVQVYAPTQGLLQRWLREEKGVCISVAAYPAFATKNNIIYDWTIKYRSSGHSMKRQQSFDTFSTYEKALEEALEFTLKELV